MVTEWPLVGPLSAHMLHRAWVGDAVRFEAWMRGCVAPGERLARLPAEMRAELTAGCPETMRDMAVWIRTRSSLDRFAGIEVPVTTIVSARDPVVSAAHQIELARALPGGLAQVIDSGHLPMMTDPVLFERAVRTWHANPGVPAALPPRAASGPERQADAWPVPDAGVHAAE
jgi:pimeloyl-ACP methyl ester carboxylesterase